MNGFANQSDHMIGHLVFEVLQIAENQGTSSKVTLSNLVTLLEGQSCSIYCHLLQQCGCDTVLAFDTVLARDNHNIVPAERPKYCGSVELWAQIVRKSSQGPADTSLKTACTFLLLHPKCLLQLSR